MDDPALRALLEENQRLVKENNEILRSMRRAARIALVFKIVIWAIILGLPVFLWRLYFPDAGITTPGDISASIEQFQALLRGYEGLPTQ